MFHHTAPVSCPPQPFDLLQHLVPPEADRESLSQVAFKNATILGTFLDVKFALYSCRDSNGIVHHPRTVWANSFMLTSQCDHFESCKCSALMG